MKSVIEMLSVAIIFVDTGLLEKDAIMHASLEC